MVSRFLAWFALGPALLVLNGCGTTVPAIGEIWDDQTGFTAIYLEKKIKEKIFCELNDAVATLNADTGDQLLEDIPDPKHPGKTMLKRIKFVPETWGITMTLSLTVEELSAINPSIAFNKALLPLNTIYGGNPPIPGPQSFNLGAGGTLSSDATRYDKYTFFYKTPTLETVYDGCSIKQTPENAAPPDFHGSSFLLESQLGIKPWIQKTYAIRTGVGVSDKSSSQVLTYDIKFDVVSSGNVTPTWKLTPITSPSGSLPLFNTKRERTHELTITMGPLSQDKSQPSTLAANQALASQIGSAVGAAVKSALGQ